MAATIYDVAKRAGVGIGTVSRVINDSPQITPATRQKVLQAIKELNYQPHTAAQSLARKRSNTIACVIPFFTGYFFVELLRGIQQRLSEDKYDLILYSVDVEHKKETFLKRTLEERKVDGVLLVALQISKNYAKKFLKRKLPIVLVDSYYPELDSITVDNAAGAYRATEHLIGLGHERIAMIDGQLKSLPARTRLEGYKQALEAHGRPFCEDYFVACDFETEADGFNKEAGYVAMEKLLALGARRPTAVFVSSDIQAIGAMQAIREHGLSIPEDIAVVGFDDVELAQYVGLTTMRQPILAMGRLAAERLIYRIRHAKDNGRFKHTFTTELVIRDSCGAKAKL